MMKEQARLNPVQTTQAKPKPFAGRSVLADALVPARNLTAEVEEEFAALSGSPELSYVAKDKQRAERDLSESLGVAVRIFEPPKFVYSQRQIERLSTELKKAEISKADAKVPAHPALSDQVVEEFAAQAVKVQLPLSGSSRAEHDMADIAGIRVTIRPYSRSKKKNLRELDE